MPLKNRKKMQIFPENDLQKPKTVIYYISVAPREGAAARLI